MTELLGDRLPPDLVARFSGDDPAADVGVAYPLITVDEPGTPRLNMVSAGELLAVGDRALRIVLWPRTRTGANLAAGREALLCVVWPGSVRYVRGTAVRLASPGELECFELTVRAVESDSHEGMPVATPITFDVARPGREEVLAAWRAQLATLANATRPETA
jgi:hypothetical protein